MRCAAAATRSPRRRPRRRRRQLPVLGVAPDFTGIADWLNTPGQPAAHARLAARQGRARRLLDVLVHQLPAHAPASARVVRRLPQGRLRDRRRAHAGVRVRARLGNVPQRDARPARHVAGRARQRLRDVDGVLEPVLAGRLPDRQAGPRARRTTSARATYGQTEAAIRTLLGEAGAGARGAGSRRDADRSRRRPSRTSAPSAWPATSARAIQPNVPTRLHVRLGAPRGRPHLRGHLDGRPAANRRRPRRAAAVHFRAQYVYLVLGGKGTVRALIDGKPARTIRVTSDRLYTLVSGSAPREDCSSCGSHRASTRTRSRSARRG